MKTINDKQQTWLLRRFHTLCTRIGMEDYEKRTMIESYGVSSSRDLNCVQLDELIKKLEIIANPALADMDKWRKRVMAAIGGWMKITGHETNAVLIKSIACRATGHKSFNDIPRERLINVYYAFLKKQKDLSAVYQFTQEELEILSYLN
ncbi:MAG: hypothetical protein A2W90_14520 [Bacteroidetes bacterium GWF2_42_66]|nr:MAG: hypothetical protein A2W92_15915 [Bacteroidetes bacterium GWA2_42_15]OFX99090.1 MAG: hypothetical protein A2W89_06740 [Bacteroidetes bacterium GWE2_42_39]OFY46741.1 MAG: hypothetical protein A2W90_14520 [Bacteroidetes bacterium GWF2_42_66]HBL73853.1 hypothetical protein [Prolixibacteraceae bacterium]HCU63214.1 hypothetical protein [Prolixibacteraceae bacterium]